MFRFVGLEGETVFVSRLPASDQAAGEGEMHQDGGAEGASEAVIATGAVIPRSGATRDLARDSRTLAAEVRSCGEDPSLRSG
jgi:hypothetical protein